MVFLGYILPKEQQTIYNKDTALALKNYKNDIASMAFTKPAAAVQSQPLVLAPRKVENIVNDVLNDIISSALKPAVKVEMTSKTSSAASRPTSPLQAELKAKLASPKLGLKSKNLTVDTTIEEKPSPSVSVTSSTTTSPTGTEFSAITQSTMSDLMDQLESLKAVGVTGKKAKERDLIRQMTTDLFKQELKSDRPVYGARSNNQGKPQENLLLKLVGDDIRFKDNDHLLQPEMLSKSLKLNLIARNALQGQGIKKTGVRKYNSEQNFGKYNLSLKALRKGNLTIYRPASNHILINRKNISPRLIKMINEIRGKMKFELEDYDNLKKAEQMVIDQIINLLRMDYPAKMRRTLDEEVWNLKQRYEILISEINAGNDGKLVKDELRDVLFKLKELKVITKRKHDFIVNAIG
jgi:hypothetical protein